jgi:hypothetical protein
MASPGVIYNHDVVGIYNRMNRFLVELNRAASAGVSQTSTFDQGRLTSYLTNIKGYVAWVQGQPQLDLPETHPREYVLEPKPDISEVENEETNDLQRIFAAVRDEVISSQSARLASSLIKFDEVRILAVVGKAEAFLANYIATLTPLDLPESSPDAPLSGPGKTGV